MKLNTLKFWITYDRELKRYTCIQTQLFNSMDNEGAGSDEEEPEDKPSKKIGKVSKRQLREIQKGNLQMEDEATEIHEEDIIREFKDLWLFPQDKMYINKAIDSDDEENLSVPRDPLTKQQRADRKLFQNNIMAEML